MKKFLCLALCLLLLVSIPVTAWAEDDSTPPASSDPSDPPPSSEPTPPPPHQHSFSGWHNDGETHSRSCSCGTTESGISHSYDAGTVTTQPTCKDAGVKTFTCTANCGKTRTEEVSATGTHIYTNGAKVNDTTHELTCSGCGGKITENHNWSVTQTVAATCQADGSTTSACTKCPATKTDTITKLTTHRYSNWTTDAERHTRSCPDCGHVDAGNHSWGTVTVIKAATCKEAGSTSQTCTACSLIKYQDVPKLTTHTYDNDCDAECNVCKETRTPNHKFADVWSSNNTGHWLACLLCGEKKEHIPHVPGPAATEYQEQICMACKYVLTPKLNHVHTPSKKWTTDRNGHWRTCSGCVVELDFDRHEYGTGCEGCKVCGYVNPDNHIYDGSWESDKMSHWGKCTVCGEVSELKEHTPGPEATEDTPQTCTVCGYIIAEFIEHNHEPLPQWYSNDAEHWQICECGEKLDVDPHIWDEGIRNKDTVTYKCVLCGETDTRIEEAPKEQGFPWIALLVILIILLLAAFGTLAWIILQPKQSGKFTNK